MTKHVETWTERLLFGSRWLLAPFYIGLVCGLPLLFVVFVRELWDAVTTCLAMPMEGAILSILSLIDLALAANLIVVIVLAGYENFVSKINTAEHEDRPSWMGKVGFAGLKLKLYGSIVAISGIQLLKAFMGIGGRTVDTPGLIWLTVIHLTFVLTTVLSALGDLLTERSKVSGA